MRLDLQTSRGTRRHSLPTRESARSADCGLQRSQYGVRRVQNTEYGLRSVKVVAAASILVERGGAVEGVRSRGPAAIVEMPAQMSDFVALPLHPSYMYM